MGILEAKTLDAGDDLAGVALDAIENLEDAEVRLPVRTRPQLRAAGDHPFVERDRLPIPGAPLSEEAFRPPEDDLDGVLHG